MDSDSIDTAAQTAGMRHAMVASQLRPNAVTDPRLIAAMASIAREAHLPAASRAAAYRDTAISLGHGRATNSPLATAKLINAAALVREDRVLLIGANGGYTAAVLAAMGMIVVAVEEHPDLATLASESLADTAVVVVEAPLAQGAPDHAPFDVLMIDGAVETIPDALAAQVRPEGRIVSGLIERGVTRLAAGRRSAGGHGLVAFADSECVVLPGFSQPQGFRF